MRVVLILAIVAASCGSSTDEGGYRDRTRRHIQRGELSEARRVAVQGWEAGVDLERELTEVAIREHDLELASTYLERSAKRDPALVRQVAFPWAEQGRDEARPWLDWLEAKGDERAGQYRLGMDVAVLEAVVEQEVTAPLRESIRNHTRPPELGPQFAQRVEQLRPHAHRMDLVQRLDNVEAALADYARRRRNFTPIVIPPGLTPEQRALLLELQAEVGVTGELIER